MPLPSKPYQSWKPEDLKQLVEEPNARESAALDFKKQCNLLHGVGEAKEKAKLDILKDIAAMANGVGGALLIGVAETGKQRGTPAVASELPGVPTDTVPSLQQAIKGIADTHLAVRPGSLRFYPVPVPDKEDRSVLIVVVPQNTYSLSMVTYNDLNQFWVRRGTDNSRMTTDEIHYEIERMIKVTESAEQALEDVCSHIKTSAQDDPIVWFAGVPLARYRDHVPVDIEAIRIVLRKSGYFSKYKSRDVSGTFAPVTFVDRLRPNLRGIGLREDDRRSGQLEIRRDGTVLFGIAYPEEKQIWFGAFYETWCSGLCLLKDIQDQFGLSRLALVGGGAFKCNGMKIGSGGRPWPGNTPVIGTADLQLDRIMLDENWTPEVYFHSWAKQFSNELGSEEAISLKPWICR